MANDHKHDAASKITASSHFTSLPKKMQTGKEGQSDFSANKPNHCIGKFNVNAQLGMNFSTYALADIFACFLLEHNVRV